MTEAINNLANNSSLAQAAYAELDNVILLEDYIEALTSSDGQPMTLEQATAFANRYDVVDQRTNSLSGFSGTLFFDNVESKYVMAMRGSEFEATLDVFPDLFFSD